VLDNLFNLPSLRSHEKDPVDTSHLSEGESEMLRTGGIMKNGQILVHSSLYSYTSSKKTLPKKTVTASIATNLVENEQRNLHQPIGAEEAQELSIATNSN
jgi:hypothetical protein